MKLGLAGYEVGGIGEIFQSDVWGLFFGDPAQIAYDSTRVKLSTACSLSFASNSNVLPVKLD